MEKVEKFNLEIVNRGKTLPELRQSISKSCLTVISNILVSMNGNDQVRKPRTSHTDTQTCPVELLQISNLSLFR